MSDYIILEKDKATAIITISREKALNALNSQVIDELSQAIDAVKADKDIRALIITGAGRAFCRRSGHRSPERFRRKRRPPVGKKRFGCIQGD